MVQSDDPWYAENKKYPFHVIIGFNKQQRVPSFAYSDFQCVQAGCIWFDGNYNLVNEPSKHSGWVKYDECNVLFKNNEVKLSRKAFVEKFRFEYMKHQISTLRLQNEVCIYVFINSQHCIVISPALHCNIPSIALYYPQHYTVVIRKC